MLLFKTKRMKSLGLQHKQRFTKYRNKQTDVTDNAKLYAGIGYREGPAKGPYACHPQNCQNSPFAAHGVLLESAGELKSNLLVTMSRIS